MKTRIRHVLKVLQDVSIQNKLIGIFALVFVSGILAIGWNTYNLNDTRHDVKNVISDSRKNVQDTLTTSKGDIAAFSSGNVDQVNQIFDSANEMQYLQIVRFDFYELEAWEKDYILAGDPTDAQGMVASRNQNSDWTREDLGTLRDLATSDDVLQLADTLLAQLDIEDQKFAEMVDQMQTDPEAARRLALDGSGRKATTIYGPIADLYNAHNDALIGSLEQSRTQLQDTLDQTDQRMQTTIDQTDREMKTSLKHADSQMKKAINVSLLTIILFGLAGAVVAITTFIVSRQIVQPVLTMSLIAEAIETEHFQDQNAESLTPIAVREDEIGKLARVFKRMASEVFARVERLKQQVAELRIVIDEQKMKAQVSEITDSEYFTDLQSKVKSLRRRSKPDAAPAESAPPTEPPTAS